MKNYVMLLSIFLLYCTPKLLRPPVIDPPPVRHESVIAITQVQADTPQKETPVFYTSALPLETASQPAKILKKHIRKITKIKRIIPADTTLLPDTIIETKVDTVATTMSVAIEPATPLQASVNNKVMLILAIIVFTMMVLVSLTILAYMRRPPKVIKVQVPKDGTPVEDTVKVESVNKQGYFDIQHYEVETLMIDEEEIHRFRIKK